MPDSIRLRPYVVASWVTAALMLVCAGAGLLPGFYSQAMSASLAAGQFGADVITLLAVPLLVWAALSSGRGSPAALAIWAGILGYVAYSYALLAFGQAFTVIYPLYLALTGLPVFILAGLISQVDVERYRALFVRRPPVRAVMIALLVLVVCLAAVWSALMMMAMSTRTQSPLNGVFVLDLGLILPACALTVFWLARRQAQGFVMGGVLLVLAALMCLSLTISSLVGFANATVPLDPINSGQAIFFGVYGLVASALSVAWLRCLPAR